MNGIKVRLDARIRVELTGYGAEVLNKAREEVAGNLVGAPEWKRSLFWPRVLKAGDVVEGVTSDLFYYFGPLMAGDGLDGRAWVEDSFWVLGDAPTEFAPNAAYGFLGGVVEAIQAPRPPRQEGGDEDVLFAAKQ